MKTVVQRIQENKPFRRRGVPDLVKQIRELLDSQITSVLFASITTELLTQPFYIICAP